MASQVGRYVLLRTGARMPAIGFGTFQAKKAQLQSALECALDVGYRHIDTAVSYQNDEDMGQVLGQAVRTGKLKRSDLFITSKVPPVFMAEEDVKPCVMEALDNLQTKYLDMLLVHVPFGSQNQGDGNLVPVDKDGNRILYDHDYIQTWKAMEGLVKDGHVRAIGLSNFDTKQITEVMDNARILPANLQHECHAYLQQDTLRAFCKQNEIINTGYSPMGAPTRPARYFKESQKVLLQEPVVLDIAEQLKKSPAQVVIRFISQLGVIPLPKSVTPERIQENFEAMTFEIPDKHVRKLRQLNCNVKYFEFEWAMKHPRFPTGEF